MRDKLESSPAPELRAALERKIEKVSNRLKLVMDEKLVVKQLDDLEFVFDKIEERLLKTKRGKSWINHRLNDLL
jgi:hypothetical protein